MGRAKSILSTFLNEVYADKQTSNDGGEEIARYTYVNGSTSHGLVCYHDNVAVSNHSTDSAKDGKRNAFDLVRIHLFGHLNTSNILCIIENGPILSNKIWYDLFDEAIHCAELP